jgi:hypothetical protein
MLREKIGLEASEDFLIHVLMESPAVLSIRYGFLHPSSFPRVSGEVGEAKE